VGVAKIASSIASKEIFCYGRLQLDVCNLSMGRRHLVYAYEVKAGIGVIAGKYCVIHV